MGWGGVIYQDSINRCYRKYNKTNSPLKDIIIGRSNVHAVGYEAYTTTNATIEGHSKGVIPPTLLLNPFPLSNAPL